MAFLEAALASTPALPSSSSRFSLVAALSPARRRLCTSFRSHGPPETEDIEDSENKSLIEKLRPRKALSVSRLINSQWCEKQAEFAVKHGRKQTPAMLAGAKRHTELEEEVVQKAEVRINSQEDYWAVRFSNFIVGRKNLLSKGLTRELPVIGVFEGTWITGVIDEVQMPLNDLNPLLVETKTRCKAKFPAEEQDRNARFQLMFYKFLCDQLVSGPFPIDDFFDYFNLVPHYILSEGIKQYIAAIGFHTPTLKDLVTCFSRNCTLLRPSRDQLLLRYELQEDHSLLKEDLFEYDADSLKNMVRKRLGFWWGRREAMYVPNSEIWKCNFCEFKIKCPMGLLSRSTTR